MPAELANPTESWPSKRFTDSTKNLHDSHTAQLINIVSQSTALMRALRAAKSLRLDSWCIGAGAIRNRVWDHLHGIEPDTWPADIDLAFFDQKNTSSAHEQALQLALSSQLPECTWDVVNQATVHHWYPDHFQLQVPPLASLEDGIASWPEYATCIGAFLGDADNICIIAPHGLDDLFNMVIRRNPARVSVDSYRTRIASKQFTQRWPKVRILPG